MLLCIKLACGGLCQVTEAHGDRLCFDIIMETLRATNLGALQIGASVNFERSARVGDEIGGHNVSGHVCSTATVSRIEDSENNRRLTFKVLYSEPPSFSWCTAGLDCNPS